MATRDDVAQLAAALPEVVEDEHRDGPRWSVAGKVFAWERPLRKTDIRRFGAEEPPSGTILAVRVEDLGEKEAMLAAGRRGLFTIPHFDGYPAVLIQLHTVSKRTLREVIEDGWLACAPPRLTDDYIARQSRRS